MVHTCGVQHNLFCQVTVAKSTAHLGGGDEDFARLGGAQVVHDAHELGGLRARLLRLGHVQIHLVAVKVSVIWIAHALIEAERPAALAINTVRVSSASVRYFRFLTICQADETL